MLRYHNKSWPTVVIVLTALALGACDSCACGGGSGSTETSELTEQTETTRVQGLELDDADFPGAAVLLPRAHRLDDLVYVERPATYDAATLPELLGDEASSFVANGLEQAAHGVLRSTSGDDEAGVQIYLFRLSSPPAAQQQWDADHQDVTCGRSEEISQQHCLSESGLELLRGPWYMRFVAEGDAATREAVRESLIDAARAVSAQMDETMRSPRPTAPSGP